MKKIVFLVSYERNFNRKDKQNVGNQTKKPYR